MKPPPLSSARLENPIQEEHFATARLLMEALVQDDRWTTAEGWDSDWIFRGQASSHWPLQPSAWREGNAAAYERLASLRKTFITEFEQKFDRTRGTYSRLEHANKEHLGLAYAQARAESTILLEFARLADRLGYNLGESATEVMRSLAPVDDSSHLESLVLFPEYSLATQPSSLLALAQHHGIPTRLLDWSRSALHAAFFAASSVQRGNEGGHIAVWALNTSDVLAPVRTALVENDSVLFDVYDPPKNTNVNLFSQQGLFTVACNPFRHLHETGELPSIECMTDHLRSYGKSAEDFITRYVGMGDIGLSFFPTLRKLTLPQQECGSLLRLLWLRGVSSAHLMPSLDNVTRALSLRWQWSQN